MKHTFLDLRTLMFAYGVLMLSASVGFVIAAHCLRRFHALPFWSVSSALMGLGSMLLTARGDIPGEYSVILGNALITSSVVLMVMALAQDFGVKVRYRVLLGSLFVSVTGVFWAYYVEPSTNLRFVFVSGLNGVLMLWGAWMGVCHLRRGDSHRVVIGILLPMLVVGCCALSMGVLGAFEYFRGADLMESYAGASIYDFKASRLLAGLLVMLASLGMYFCVVLFVAIRLNAELTRQAHYDALTGLYNRRMFYELAVRELALDLRRGFTSSILFIDIDHFKRINDNFGHAAGDQVLRAFADFLRQHCRQEDVIARFGGEEFCVLMPTVDAQGAYRLAKRLCQGAEALEVYWSGLRLPLTISIGVTERCNFNEEMDPLIQRADQAMYQAKQGGRNRVVLAAA